MGTKLFFPLLRFIVLASVVARGCLGAAQPANGGAEESVSANALSDALRDLRQQVRDLQQAVAEMRSENAQVRAESAELRREVERLRLTEPLSRPGKLESTAAANQRSATDSPTGEAASHISTRVAQLEEQESASQTSRETGLEEEYDLLAGKIDDQYQTKVESASKYRMRLSGIVLLNLFSNRGSFDSADVPTLATPRTMGYPNGSFGATLRQSQIGFEVFGPQLGGARTRADLQLDFGGGFEASPNGISAGLMRLRTGTVRLDWKNTSVVAGQDNLFFSPGAPTSFASLIVPAFSYAGNLWGWIPQVRVERRVSVGEESNLTFQGGILDPLSGETPGPWSYRLPGPGEASRQPAFGSRVGWSHTLFGQPMRVGVGGFYSRQSYGFDRFLNAWAGMTDLEVPLSHRFSVSGKIFRGEGLGGLYGGIARSVLFNGDPGNPASLMRGLNTVGGWGQLKYQATSKIEFNTAFGLDNPFAKDLKAFPAAQAYGDPTLARNSAGLANVIFRPRSDLIFSVEYRHLRTYDVSYSPNSADHVNLMMGVLF